MTDDEESLMAAEEATEMSAALTEEATDAAAVATEEAAVEGLAAQDPNTVVGIDRAGDGTYDYVSHAEAGQHALRITDQGRGYDHVATDVAGVWLYR